MNNWSNLSQSKVENREFFRLFDSIFFYGLFRKAITESRHYQWRCSLELQNYEVKLSDKIRYN